MHREPVGVLHLSQVAQAWPTCVANVRCLAWSSAAVLMLDSTRSQCVCPPLAGCGQCRQWALCFTQDHTQRRQLSCGLIGINKS